MVNDNLMTKITATYSRMTKAEKKVADIVLSNPQMCIRDSLLLFSRIQPCLSSTPYFIDVPPISKLTYISIASTLSLPTEALPQKLW